MDHIDPAYFTVQIVEYLYYSNQPTLLIQCTVYIVQHTLFNLSTAPISNNNYFFVLHVIQANGLFQAQGE